MAEFDHIREYYVFCYCNMQAGPARVEVCKKLNALNCWEVGE